MFVIKVIPLLRGSHIGTLSYYSKNSYEVGSIVTIGVRKKIVRGLVVETETVSTAKTTLRAATFTLRKLPEQESITELPAVLIETAKTLAKNSPATIGSILYSVLPSEIQNGDFTLDAHLPCVGIYETPLISILTGSREDRWRTYRSRIREAFAHRGSVLLLAPTGVSLENLEEALSPGIKERVITFLPGASKKQLERAYAGLKDLSQAKLILATPTHCCLERHDITHVIIEESRSPFYKARVRPYIDVREIMTVLAKKTGRELIMGDLLPRTEEEYLRRMDIYQTENEHPKRILLRGELKINKLIPQTEQQKFVVISDYLKSLIDSQLNNRKNILLLSARRGLAPVIVCMDCGYVFRCPDSGSPYSLLRTKKNGLEERWFVSFTSGKKVPASENCPECNSWRLKEKGVGIQQVYDELIKDFSSQKITVFDHTTATTKRKAKQLVAEFYESKGKILLATNMVLPYLYQNLDKIAITSLEATRSTPSWRADEDFLSLLLQLRELANDSVHIETVDPEDPIIEYAKTGLTDQFYTDEIALRENLQYPPFVKFIHLTISGDQKVVTDLELEIQEKLSQFSPKFYQSVASKANTLTKQCLIRVKREQWPDKDLINQLKSLPPTVRIEIDPTRIV